MGTWKERERPPQLERRYTFTDYEALRGFRDQAAELSETAGYYPDLAFGRDYLNVTIAATDGGALSEMHRRFADDLDALGGYTS